ncbi:hypothetical protein CVT25_007653 [Psilocybe cyanescens]|uniref:Uncharacterized protein n=1 Tax=Psilocybe cyanescens TaxID=93625 RepID=A0A409XT77_PSICY|nr:hypothetical protein CVT25_007653 [Psilocybe cyanescens]
MLLSMHPWFVIDALGVSLRSAGKPYRLAVNWKQSMPVPQAVQEVMGLDADVAGEVFRAEDLTVFSNAKNFRRDLHVPLIVSLVNSLSSCSSRCCSRHLLQCEELPLGPARPAHRLAHEHRPPCRHPAAAGAVLAVFSNAKNFRRDPHVLLIVSLMNSLSSCSSRCCSCCLFQCKELPLGPVRPAHCLARELAIILQQQALFSPSSPMRRTSAGTSAGTVLAVFSNVKNFRWDPQVPLIVSHRPPRHHPAAAGAVLAAAQVRLHRDKHELLHDRVCHPARSNGAGVWAPRGSHGHHHAGVQAMIRGSLPFLKQGDAARSLYLANNVMKAIIKNNNYKCMGIFLLLLVDGNVWKQANVLENV